MTSETFTKLVEETFSQMKQILTAKGTDYTSGNSDRLSNFRITEAIGIASAEQGLLCRMVDKIARVTSFVNTGKLAVTNESAVDAVHDIIGYAILMKALLQDKQSLKEEVDARLVRIQASIPRGSSEICADYLFNRIPESKL